MYKGSSRVVYMTGVPSCYLIMVSHSPRVVVTGSVSHGIAILCTIFRLLYRCWTRQLWWEDAWAALALSFDVICLAWIHTSFRPTWIFGVAFTSVVWAARMSLIFSIIRTANSSGDKIHKRITYLIAASFMVMWAALVVYKISVCIYYSCRMTKAVALSQLVTDVAADASLIVAPIQFWKDVGLTRNSKILILSTFGSSVLITVITIPHSIMLFHSITETVIIVAHVKAALSLVICNLLVIVTLVYRVCWKEMLDLDQSFTSPGIFSSVIVTQFPFNTNSRMSPSIQEEHTRHK